MAFQNTDKYIGLVQDNGHTLIRDPRTLPLWHDISSLPGYPSGVTSVSLVTVGSTLDVTVRTDTDTVAQASCSITLLPIWPANCTSFVDVSPAALRLAQLTGKSRNAPAQTSRVAKSRKPMTQPRGSFGILGPKATVNRQD